MSANKVHALFYGTPGGFGLDARASLKGLFATVELAEKRLLADVLAGASITAARIDTLDVVQPHDPKDPLQYPDVIGELLQHRKIQTIKNMRAKVDGLFLAEAKRLVESVDLDALTPAQREAALAAVQPTPPERERYSLVHCWHDYDILVDDGGDKWGRIGDDLYVILPYGWNDTDPFPFKDEYRTTLSEDEVRDTYGIDRSYDLN